MSESVKQGVAPDAALLARRRVPVQERGRQRVDRLVDAAERLLARMPVHRVTATAIAAEAGVPIGSLYQYFPNRLAVLAELLQRGTREADAKTVEAIEACHDLPWTDAVDRVVDAVMQNFARLHARPADAMLQASAARSPEFHGLAAASSARVARALAAHPALVAAIADPARRWLVARTAVEAGTGVQGWALEPRADDHPADLSEITGEMKTLLKAYLGRHLEESP